MTSRAADWLRALVPPRAAWVLATAMVGALVLCAVVPIYFGGLAGLLGFVMGVTAGLASALASVTRLTKVITGLLCAAAGVLGMMYADNALLAALAVFAMGLIQAPLNIRALSLGVFLPVVVSVFATVNVSEEPLIIGFWILVGFAAIQWLTGLFNVQGQRQPGQKQPVTEPTAEFAQESARKSVWTHAVVFAVTAGAIQFLLMEWGTPHGYWLVLTLASVLRPVVGETRTVATDRIIGTVAGVALALMIVWSIPQALVLLIALPCTSLMLAWAALGEVQKETMFGTPTVVLFASAGALDITSDVAFERLVLTAVGVAMALAAVAVFQWLDGPALEDGHTLEEE